LSPSWRSARPQPSPRSWRWPGRHCHPIGTHPGHCGDRCGGTREALLSYAERRDAHLGSRCGPHFFVFVAERGGRLLHQYVHRVFWRLSIAQHRDRHEARAALVRPRRSRHCNQQTPPCQPSPGMEPVRMDVVPACTSFATAPLAKLSSTIRSFSVVVQHRRRSRPERTVTVISFAH
jgi:hypothetical protein